MGYEVIKVDIADGIGLVTFNRPEKRNAMNPRFIEEMTRVLAEVRYDDSVRVLVLTGAGTAFCAGMDLKEFFHDNRADPARFDSLFRASIEWRMRTLRYFPKPTIAMVNGFCFGGAFPIVEACDLAFCAEDATFGLSEINFKLFPGGAVSKSLANLFRPRDALFYGLTGRPFDGRTAERIGFVNRALPATTLRAETMAIAAEIAQKDAFALKATKESYRYCLEMTSEAAINYAAAKEAELILRQQDRWREEGIPDFLAGKFKPGLEGHESVGKDR